MYGDNGVVKKVDFSLTCDYHSHILPKMDDGARDVEESIKLINTAKSYGVEKIVATPHCYLHKMNVDKFCQKREEAFAKLSDANPQLPIELGAEILLFPGIDEMDGIERLTMGETKVMLIELPLSETIITENYFITVEELTRKFQVVMAHANRYSEHTVRQMLEIGTDIQVNAEDVCNYRQKKRVEYWAEGSFSIALGTDAHHNTKLYRYFAKAKKTLSKFL